MMNAVILKDTPRFVFFILVIASVCGCSSEPQQIVSSLASSMRQSPEGAVIAARVNGRPISLDDIRGLAADAKGQFTPKEALDILVRNALLADEARRRGYDKAPEIAAIRKDAIARALLMSEVGDTVTADNLSPDLLMQYYETHKKRYVHAEKRRVVHLLARTGPGRMSDDKAKQTVEQARAAALFAADETDFLNRVKPFVDAAEKSVKTESLPAFEESDRRFVRPFVEATFAIPKVGDISPPVKTEFGLHIIYLTEDIEAVNRSFEEVKSEIAAKVLPKAQKKRAREIISSLLSKNRVFVYDEALKEGRFPE